MKCKIKTKAKNLNSHKLLKNHSKFSWYTLINAEYFNISNSTQQIQLRKKSILIGKKSFNRINWKPAMTKELLTYVFVNF